MAVWFATPPPHPHHCPRALQGALLCMVLGLACHGFSGMAVYGGMAAFSMCAFSTLLDLDKWLPRCACAVRLSASTCESKHFVRILSEAIYIYMQARRNADFSFHPHRQVVTFCLLLFAPKQCVLQIFPI